MRVIASLKQCGQLTSNGRLWEHFMLASAFVATRQIDLAEAQGHGLMLVAVVEEVGTIRVGDGQLLEFRL
jgi:hypothetical protein